MPKDSDTRSGPAPRKRRPWLDDRGAVAIQTAVIMLVLLGMVSLGVEITFLLMKHRQMQTTADAAALAGAQAVHISEAAITTEAHAVASEHGYRPGVNNVVVTVNHPPLSGPRAGDDQAVEAIVSQPQVMNLARLFRVEPYDVGARAVAVLASTGNACILALDTSSTAASALIWNNAVVSSPDCGVAVNSTHSAALELRNNAVLNGAVYVRGGIDQANNAEINGSPVTTYADDPIVDPYADRVLDPTPAQQASTCPSLLPGYYPNGITVGLNQTCTMAPGVYYVNKELTLRNNATLNGTGGVTIVVNNNYAIDIENNVHVNLTAPTTGPTAGIALYGRRTNSASITQIFQNNAIFNIVGAIYFPSQKVLFRNNGITANSRCTQLIAFHVEFRNNVAFDHNCSGTGVEPIGGGAGATLVE